MNCVRLHSQRTVSSGRLHVQIWEVTRSWIATEVTVSLETGEGGQGRPSSRYGKRTLMLFGDNGRLTESGQAGAGAVRYPPAEGMGGWVLRRSAAHFQLLVPSGC